MENKIKMTRIEMERPTGAGFTRERTAVSTIMLEENGFDIHSHSLQIQ